MRLCWFRPVHLQVDGERRKYERSWTSAHAIQTKRSGCRGTDASVKLRSVVLPPSAPKPRKIPRRLFLEHPEAWSDQLARCQGPLVLPALHRLAICTAGTSLSRISCAIPPCVVAVYFTAFARSLPYVPGLQKFNRQPRFRIAAKATVIKARLPARPGSVRSHAT